jgi:3-phosphoshikimate 1-carboxyvinyltransferase
MDPASSIRLSPGGALRGTVQVPGDKSITHRAIMLAALADGETELLDYCRGEDCLNTARAFRGMGLTLDETPDRLRIVGKGFWGLSEPDGPIDCGNSGTGIRLLAGLLAGQEFFTVLTGDESIRRRPMGRVVKPLRSMGAVIAGRRGGELAPLAITGARLRGIAYDSPVASAQVKSAVLFAGLFADGVTRVREPRLSRDHTERMLRAFGCTVAVSDGSASVEGRPASSWPGRGRVRIPGDLSAAAFFLVAASIRPGSDVTIPHIGINPTRTGILDLLQRMGANIDVLNVREEMGEPIADLRVRAGGLRGIAVGPDDIPRTIDELPILFVAAAVAEGETRVHGAEELRVKESDRLATMAAELRKMGVSVDERADGLVISGSGGRPLRGARCESHGDHRVAMSMAVASLAADRPSEISDVGCIQTSFPDFHSKLSKLLTH